jgi:hypothetical protein
LHVAGAAKIDPSRKPTYRPLGPTMDGPGGARRSRDKQLPLACQGVPLSPVNLNVCVEYNPNLTTAWFTSVKGCNRSGLGWEAAARGRLRGLFPDRVGFEDLACLRGVIEKKVASASSSGATKSGSLSSLTMAMHRT